MTGYKGAGAIPGGAGEGGSVAGDGVDISDINRIPREYGLTVTSQTSLVDIVDLCRLHIAGQYDDCRRKAADMGSFPRVTS